MKRTRSALALAALIAALPAAAADFTIAGTVRLPGWYEVGPASAYPLEFWVSQLSGQVTDVNLTLTGLYHDYPADLDFLLVGPSGRNVMLMSDVGGTYNLGLVTYVFDQQAPSGLVQGYNQSGSYLPSDFGSGFGEDPMPDLSVGPWGSTLDVFNGTDANGLWRLYINDDEDGYFGFLMGTTLSIRTTDVGAIPEPTTWVLMTLGFGAIGAALRRDKVKTRGAFYK